jgi:hypothetical protein
MFPRADREELLRTDPAHHILGMRLNFFVAAGLFVSVVQDGARS